MKRFTTLLLCILLAGVTFSQDYPTLELDQPAPDFDLPESFLLGIRPEDVTPHPEGEFFGKVTLTEPLGVETIVHIKANGQSLLSLVSGITNLTVGDEVRFNTNHERLHFFAMDGKRVQ